MGIPSSVIQPMQKVQNTAARLILRSPRHKNCTPLLQQLSWFLISERIQCNTACMYYNAVTGSVPSYLSELLHLYSPSGSLRSSSDTRMLKLQCFNRKTHGFRTFSHFGPHIWNNLPQDIRLLSLPSKANSRLLSSQNISVKQHCPSPLLVCTVYFILFLFSVCVCVCACVRACVRVCACVRACTKPQCKVGREVGGRGCNQSYCN